MSNGSFQKPLVWKPGKVEQQDSGTTRDWNKKTVKQQEIGTRRQWNNKKVEQQEIGPARKWTKSAQEKDTRFQAIHVSLCICV
jgi:hypothetical protein